MSPSLRRRRSPATADDGRASSASDAGAAAPAAAPAASANATLTEAAPASASPAARRRTLARSGPFPLLRAAHPRLGVLVAAGMAVAAVLSGRSGREVLLVLVTVLVGQAVLGWHNDLVDRERDRAHGRSGKPLADGRLDPGTAWFAWCCGVLLLIPLAVNNGVLAGCCYLGSVAVGLLGNLDNRLVRRGLLSWLPWAVAFGLYPAFLSYGGWGGQEKGAPPELLVTGLAALLGIGVHFLTALWGLVPDNEDRWTYLPLRLGLKIGASRLLWVASTYTALVIVGLAFAGTYVGLAQEPL